MNLKWTILVGMKRVRWLLKKTIVNLLWIICACDRKLKKPIGTTFWLHFPFKGNFSLYGKGWQHVKNRNITPKEKISQSKHSGYPNRINNCYLDLIKHFLSFNGISSRQPCFPYLVRGFLSHVTWQITPTMHKLYFDDCQHDKNDISSFRLLCSGFKQGIIPNLLRRGIRPNRLIIKAPQPPNAPADPRLPSNFWTPRSIANWKCPSQFLRARVVLTVTTVRSNKLVVKNHSEEPFPTTV